MVPIVGSRRPESILDSLAALELQLSDEELDVLSGSGAAPGR
jgi:aryl-alcohol dehydrogenase-like predicted oxidoreductase